MSRASHSSWTLKGITWSVIGFFKSGALFLQGYAGQVPGLADDLHVMLQLLQAAADDIEFGRGIGTVGCFDWQYFLRY